MTISSPLSPTTDIWSGHADFPAEPAFYRGVLDAMPTPLLVADADGLVVYGNGALMALLQRSKTEGIRTNIYDYVHPDDLGSIADAFITLATADHTDASTQKPWAPVRCRLLLPDGSSLPVEVVGFDRMSDPDIDGFVYEIRPMLAEEIFTRVMRGDPALRGSAAFDAVVEMMTVTNVDMASAMVELAEDGTVALLAVSSSEIATALKECSGSLAQFLSGPREATPSEAAVEMLPGTLGARLGSLRVRKVWKLDVASPMNDRRYVLLACSTFARSSNLGVVECLERAGDLASVVLLRKWVAMQHAGANGRPNR